MTQKINRPPKKRGRKEKYATNVEPYLDLVRGWAFDGLLEKEICYKLGVSVAVWCEYKLKYPELVDALKANKEKADRKVEQALYKRALGYTYEEEIQEVVHIKGKEEVRGTKKIIKKTVPPDVTAQIFWLKNRQRDKWTDRQLHELSGSIDTTNVEAEKDIKDIKKKINELIEKRQKLSDAKKSTNK